MYIRRFDALQNTKENLEAFRHGCLRYMDRQPKLVLMLLALSPRLVETSTGIQGPVVDGVLMANRQMSFKVEAIQPTNLHSDMSDGI